MRRSSDGDAISLMESSTDGLEGEEPGSPRAWGAVDWTDSASSLAHVFVSTSSSLDTCYLQSECLHSGHRWGQDHCIKILFYNYNQPGKFLQHCCPASPPPLGNQPGARYDLDLT